MLSPCSSASSSVRVVASRAVRGDSGLPLPVDADTAAAAAAVAEAAGRGGGASRGAGGTSSNKLGPSEQASEQSLAKVMKRGNNRSFPVNALAECSDLSRFGTRSRVCGAAG
jgi:hypothetical protein